MTVRHTLTIAANLPSSALAFTVLFAFVALPFGPHATAQDVVSNYISTLFQTSYQGVSADHGDSGCVAVGYSRTQFSALQGIYTKFSSTGQILWGGSYGEIGDESFYGVVATSDHGALAAGGKGAAGTGAQDYLAVKFDSVGNIEWERTGGGVECTESIRSVTQLTDGGYVLAGFRYCPGATISDFTYSCYLVKLTEAGAVAWENTFSSSKWHTLSQVDATPDGGFVVSGILADDEGLNGQAYVSKHNSGGGLSWSWLGPPNPTEAEGLRALPDGGVIVCVEGVGSPADVQLVRLTPAGNLMWDKVYPLPGAQFPTDVEVHCDGGFSVISSDYSQANLKGQIDVLRVSSDGTELWRHDFGGLYDDYPWDVAITPDGKLLIAATRDSRLVFSTFYYYAGLLKLTDGSRYLTIMSGDNAKLKEAEVEFRKITSTKPVWDDTLMFRDTTDIDGRICVCDTLFGKSSQFKVRKFLHSEPTTRHSTYFGTKYSVTIDNMNVLTDGSIEYDTLTDAHQQDLVLDHSTFAFNLAVSVEWDTRDGYLASLQNSFRYLNNYLYDVYDGQVVLDTVAIADDREHWDAADVRYYASNVQWPRATAAGIDDPPPAFLHMPRNFFGSLDETRNGTFVEYPPVLTATDHYRTLGHELGHYVLGFKDEYVFPVGSGKCPSNPPYGYMETHYDTTKPMTSEMSSSIQYTDVACQNTAQYVENGRSCWDYFEYRFQKTYGIDTIHAEVLKPTERSLPALSTYLMGPNESNSSLDYDVSSHIVFSQAINNATSATKTVTARRRANNAIVTHLPIDLHKSASLVIEQGETSDGGKIRVLDVSPGDRIRASGSFRLVVAKNNGRAIGEEWLFGEAIDGGAGKSQFGNEYWAFDDEIDLELIPVHGDYAFIADLSPTATDVTLRLYVNSQFPESPSVDHTPDGGSTQSFSLFSNGNVYTGSLGGATGLAGKLTINAIDDSLAQFFVDTEYSSRVNFVGGVLSALDGSAELTATPTTPWELATLLTSSYPVLRNGLTDDNIQAGNAVSLGLIPEDNFAADGLLVIRYADSDLEIPGSVSADEATLRIFKWDTQAGNWTTVGGSVDTAFNEVSALIADDGVFAAFTTAGIVAPPCGDMNNSGSVDIADAVYLINYIFAGGPAPQDLAGGDMSCSGQTDVADAVYLVNFIFAGGPSPCAACQ